MPMLAYTTRKNDNVFSVLIISIIITIQMAISHWYLDIDLVWVSRVLFLEEFYILATSKVSYRSIRMPSTL